MTADLDYEYETPEDDGISGDYGTSSWLPGEGLTGCRYRPVGWIVETHMDVPSSTATLEELMKGLSPAEKCWINKRVKKGAAL
jgi:hypothetical protein